MTPDQAAFLRDFLLPQFEDEGKVTRKVLAAVPNQNLDYRPGEKSMPGIELTRHLATAEIWFLDSIAAGAFAPPDNAKAAALSTPGEIAAYYETALPEALARIRSLPPEKLAATIDFFGVLKMPAAKFLQMTLKHSIHHRGQLSAYIRPMGGKVPAIYGGSADEPFSASA